MPKKFKTKEEANLYNRRHYHVIERIKQALAKRYATDGGKNRAIGKRTPEQTERIRIGRWGR